MKLRMLGSGIHRPIDQQLRPEMSVDNAPTHHHPINFTRITVLSANKCNSQRQLRGGPRPRASSSHVIISSSIAPRVPRYRLLASLQVTRRISPLVHPRIATTGFIFSQRFRASRARKSRPVWRSSGGYSIRGISLHHRYESVCPSIRRPTIAASRVP